MTSLPIDIVIGSSSKIQMTFEACCKISKMADLPFKRLGYTFFQFMQNDYLRGKDKPMNWYMKRILGFFSLTKTQIPENATVNGTSLKVLFQEATEEMKMLEILEDDWKPEKSEEDQDTLLQTQALTSDKLNFMAKRMEEQYNMITELIKSRG